jgi:hypothetical protein
MKKGKKVIMVALAALITEMKNSCLGALGFEFK